MLRYGLICMVLASCVWAQSGETPSSPTPGHSPSQAAAPKLPEPQEFPADKVPQDAVIVTITGVCQHPEAAKTPADCKTTFTRAEFEKIVDALKPHAPQSARRMLATTYAQSLIREQKGLEMGLDKTADFANRLEVNRLLISHEALDDAQKQQAWDNVTDKEIEDYYKQNPAEFVEVDVLRVFVPWFEPDENKKLPEAEREKQNLAWQSKLKEEAEKLRTRALAGEDFMVLQKEAYKFTDVSSPVTEQVITLLRTRRFMLDNALMPMMDLQPGQVSQIVPEDNGYYIFKCTRRQALPLNEWTRREIRGRFRDRRIAEDQTNLKKLADSSAIYNESYFGPKPPPEPQNDAPPYDVMPGWKKNP
jgi:hypothetical protein